MKTLTAKVVVGAVVAGAGVTGAAVTVDERGPSPVRAAEPAGDRGLAAPGRRQSSPADDHHLVAAGREPGSDDGPATAGGSPPGAGRARTVSDGAELALRQRGVARLGTNRPPPAPDHEPCANRGPRSRHPSRAASRRAASPHRAPSGDRRRGRDDDARGGHQSRRTAAGAARLPRRSRRPRRRRSRSRLRSPLPSPSPSRLRPRRRSWRPHPSRRRTLSRPRTRRPSRPRPRRPRRPRRRDRPRWFVRPRDVPGCGPDRSLM